MTSIRIGLALLLVTFAGCRGPKVPFAVTPSEVVQDMLRLARVGPTDVVYDLGCGDGRIVIAAAERGARAVGVEHDVRFVLYAEDRARKVGVADRVRFVHQDFFETDVRDATVVALYLLPEINVRLRPKLLRQLRPGARVVSHAFGMEDWRPDIATPVGGPRIFVWVVPAEVAGEWRWSGGPLGAGVLRLEQRFQQVTATLELGDQAVSVERATLEGARLHLTVRRGASAEVLEARVAGESMELAAPDGSARWRARRTRRGAPLDR
jgi:SAM-dependent methyltransferase